MKIKLESQSECDVLSSVISDYEAKRRSEGRTDSEDFTKVVAELKTAIDRFMIDLSFDFIGPIKCHHCKHEWVAVFSKLTAKLPCPECYRMNEIPMNKKEEEQ